MTLRANCGPGWYSTRINGKRLFRVWWLLFAVAYYAGSADEFAENIGGWCDKKGSN